MNVLDRFLTFAKALPANQLEAIEESLADMMDSMAAKHDFTPAELIELEARLAQPEPEYSDLADITKLFGKPFRA